VEIVDDFMGDTSRGVYTVAGERRDEMTGQIHASDDEVIHPSSGNVFADPGLPEPEEDLVKATLAMRITRIVAERGWSQNEAACVMGIDPGWTCVGRGAVAPSRPTTR